MAELRGRIALITGAGRGLGRAIAVAIAGAGAEVALCARSGGELEAVAAICREASGRALVLPGDLKDLWLNAPVEDTKFGVFRM